ncbi:hypothetical protein BDF20DRAFT_849389 [Mycotypha africana]|uniref:uncharacterized protein n=1 Tax=Mycotypha africana TaxID=64632 RepID=UPI0023014AD7|nr:uncharacterized protein BDF20DRAFT_849389 [Mycotypha africana]KAI8987312.1 hypothetical protein BDF20DRAFT_849389 [Mycotypha africana]
MSSFKPNIPLQPETFTMLVPGVSPAAAALSEQLLEKNNHDFHCFFNEKKFHNHLIHHLLAAYSLGASKEKIQEIFDYHAKDQRPLPPSVGELTRENYTEQLGNGDAYTSFLNLFKKEVDKYGMHDTVRRWVWSGDLLARTIGGAYHPVIHIGYGLEFGIPAIVAEGLAMAACTEPNFTGVVPKQPPLRTSSMLIPAQAQAIAENTSSAARGYVTQFIDQLSQQISTRLKVSDNKEESTTAETGAAKSVEDDQSKDIPNFLKGNELFAVLDQIRKDPTFDSSVSFKDDQKLDAVLKDQNALNKLKDYAAQWKIEENSTDIQKKFKQLYTAVGLLLGSSGLRDDYPGVLRLDFFLMHAVTSAEFLHQYIPRVAPSEAVSLLQAHLIVSLIYYVARGRPNLNVRSLLNYKSPNHVEKSNNNWLDVFNKSLDCKEVHVIKVVRSCAVAQIIYGPDEDPELEQIWLKIAQMAVDLDGNWDFKGVGFDESWKEFK